MSRSPLVETEAPAAREAVPSRRPPARRASARIRAATVRRRVQQAMDALAVVDLLLGVNSSVRSLERGGAE